MRNGYFALFLKTGEPIFYLLAVNDTHLLMPVVTEPRKAAGALGSAVQEMERRYRLFAENNVRDIKSFNKLAAEQPELEKMPYIAIIIDELADLMMVVGKDVEDSICRIAQKAFSALLARMKYITRWSLMHSTRPESLSEHTCDTALLAHTLCLIARRYTGTPCRPKTVAVAALYHDAPEIITGDMPTPVKYSSPGLRDAYKALEAESVDSMTRLLPPYASS